MTTSQQPKQKQEQSTRISQNYERRPRPEILKASKSETKTIILARYGMLECGQNFSGTQNKQCDNCKCIDDESHRLNYCPKWRTRNLLDSNEMINFDNIYSPDPCYHSTYSKAMEYKNCE